MTSRAKKILVALVVTGVCLLIIIGVFAGTAVVGWKAAVRAGNEAATIQNLKTIEAVEVQYFSTHKRTFGTLDQLVSEQFLSSSFARHPTVKDGYVFTLSLGHKQDGSSWYKITADPQDASQGRNHFYLDSDGDSIHFNPEHQAGPGDPSQ